MIQSMTAFASRTGAMNSASWVWEMRGVNARGLDLRLRIADGIDGLEQAVRAALSASVKLRRSITKATQKTANGGQSIGENKTRIE